MSNAKITDYCSVTLATKERDDTHKTPLEQYRPRGYVRGVKTTDDPEEVALDAAVALTASSWGPPFDTTTDEAEQDAPGEWWQLGYTTACHAVENAIVDAIMEGEQ